MFVNTQNMWWPDDAYLLGLYSDIRFAARIEKLYFFWKCVPIKRTIILSGHIRKKLFFDYVLDVMSPTKGNKK